MTKTQSWWIQLFEGNLALGIDLERLNELQDERFLYFQSANLNDANHFGKSHMKTTVHAEDASRI